MKLSSPIEGFRLAYDRVGSGPPVVLLHGWPGDRTDFRDLVPLLAGERKERLRRPSLFGNIFGKKVADGTA